MGFLETTPGGDNNAATREAAAREARQHVSGFVQDTETGDIITPEEAKRRRDEKLDNGPTQH